MGLWRWFVALFQGTRTQSAPEDARYYETQHRQEVDAAAANVARATETGLSSGSTAWSAKNVRPRD